MTHLSSMLILNDMEHFFHNAEMDYTVVINILQSDIHYDVKGMLICLLSCMQMICY